MARAARLGRPARHVDPRRARPAAGRAPRAERDMSQGLSPGHVCVRAQSRSCPACAGRGARRRCSSCSQATLPELRRGLTESAARTVAYELFEKLGYGAVAVTDTHEVLAFVGAGADHHAAGRPADPPRLRGARARRARCSRRSGSAPSASTPPARSAPRPSCRCS